MGSKGVTLELEKSFVPGPGNYNPHIVEKKVLTAKFGSSEKIALSNGERIKTPGPGVYDSETSI